MSIVVVDTVQLSNLMEYSSVTQTRKHPDFKKYMF